MQTFMGYNEIQHPGKRNALIDYKVPNDLEKWSKYINHDDKEAVMEAPQDNSDGKPKNINMNMNEVEKNP